MYNIDICISTSLDDCKSIPFSPSKQSTSTTRYGNNLTDLQPGSKYTIIIRAQLKDELEHGSDSQALKETSTTSEQLTCTIVITACGFWVPCTWSFQSFFPCYFL